MWQGKDLQANFSDVWQGKDLRGDCRRGIETKARPQTRLEDSPPRGNAHECENKGVAGKAIRKNMKTKGRQIGAGNGTKRGKREIEAGIEDGLAVVAAGVRQSRPTLTRG